MKEEQKTQLEVEEIKEILPHRYPFLFVDRVLEIQGRKRIVAVKNVSLNEYFFMGHFPSEPVMPGVLIMEALAQTAGVLILRLPEYRGRVPFFASMDGVKFRRPVRPGDQLRLEVDILKLRSRAGKARGVARVGGEVAAEGELTFSLLK